MIIIMIIMMMMIVMVMMIITSVKMTMIDDGSRTELEELMRST